MVIMVIMMMIIIIIIIIIIISHLHDVEDLLGLIGGTLSLEHPPGKRNTRIRLNS